MSVLNGHAPRYENKVSTGHILTIAITIATWMIGGTGFVLRYENRLTTLEERVSVATESARELKMALAELAKTTANNTMTLAERSGVITDVYRRFADIERRMDNGVVPHPRPN